MTLHKNRVDAALAMIAEKQLNPTDVERICGVNRTQIYRWKAGEVKQMRYDSFTKLAKALNYTIEYKGEEIAITPHTKKQNTGDLTMNQQSRLIEYQEKELIQLKAENERLKKTKNNYLDNEIGTDYQFSLDAKFNFRPSQFAVDIMYVKALTTFDYIVKKLGYSENELCDIFSFGKYINYKDHTIHKLRSKDQKARMLQKASNIMRSMLFSKDEMAAYNLKLPITYLSKDGKKVHAINQFLVDWEAKTAIANIHFMNGDC